MKVLKKFKYLSHKKKIQNVCEQIQGNNARLINERGKENSVTWSLQNLELSLHMRCGWILKEFVNTSQKQYQK